MRIDYSPESVKDLVRLRKFIERENSPAARRIANSILEGVDKLSVFPRMGLPVQRAPDPELIRDLYIGQYTIRYLVGSEVIYILRVWHGKEIEKDL
ncbi:MAG: plasmid stabilization system protein ParE [Planctomycetaceae bacterium]|jgi:plasmid stabilization system protein ParE